MLRRLAQLFKHVAPSADSKSPATRALEWLCAEVEREPSPQQPAVARTLESYGAGEAAARIGRRATSRQAPLPDEAVLARLEKALGAKLRAQDNADIALAAQVWYARGRRDLGDLAMRKMEDAQRGDGGFAAPTPPGARLAAAAYLDAHRLRVRALMEAMINQFPDTVADGDGRLLAIAAHVKPGMSVLEAGCGKGRFLAALRRKFPGLQCTGADISPALLARLPAGVKAVEAPLERLPFADGEFDVAFSVEAIEHATNAAAAASELARVVKPGGRVIIVDKQRAAWGRFETPIWERWPEREELRALLARWCDGTRVEDVGYDGKAPDGLMVAWSGRRRG